MENVLSERSDSRRLDDRESKGISLSFAQLPSILIASSANPVARPSIV